MGAAVKNAKQCHAGIDLVFELGSILAVMATTHERLLSRPSVP